METSIEEVLLGLHKKISRIEDKDPDYINNEKWQELRRQQNIEYKKLAQRKLDYHLWRSQNGYEVNEKVVQIYKNYIGDDYGKSN